VLSLSVIFFLIDLVLVILQGGLFVIGYFYRGSGLFYFFRFVTEMYFWFVFVYLRNSTSLVFSNRWIWQPFRFC